MVFLPCTFSDNPKQFASQLLLKKCLKKRTEYFNNCTYNIHGNVFSLQQFSLSAQQMSQSDNN